MDLSILEKIFEIVKSGKKVALVTLTKSSGSTPRKEGTLMGVWEDGFIGTGWVPAHTRPITYFKRLTWYGYERL